MKLRVTTPCGIIKSDLVFDIQDGSEDPYLSVYPNPANTQLNIEYLYNDKNYVSSNKNVKLSKEITLLNDKGIALKTSVMGEEDSKLILDISKIPNGSYYLHITEGKETIKKQIIIKH